ncbi:NAD-dependent epimerase/dehydratase family protein, partial [Candidatus Micrarchaeota archaeon]|nr:NAD-dependent epimerase/dehydratase family protein [Candidatus Micrarchaeota archaeon]
METKIKNTKVLVTGGNGFLGKKIIKVFADAGAEVLGTSRKPAEGMVKMEMLD